MIRSALILMLAIIVTVWLPPQTGAETIPRPELAQFVSDADVVAYIRITSGVVVPAGGALYTADVVRGFKGVEKGDRIELGFYTSYAIGAEYLAFLAKTDSTYSGKITEADRSQSSASLWRANVASRDAGRHGHDGVRIYRGVVRLRS